MLKPPCTREGPGTGLEIRNFFFLELEKQEKLFRNANQPAGTRGIFTRRKCGVVSSWKKWRSWPLMGVARARDGVVLQSVAMRLNVSARELPVKGKAFCDKRYYHRPLCNILPHSREMGSVTTRMRTGLSLCSVLCQGLSGCWEGVGPHSWGEAGREE